MKEKNIILTARIMSMIFTPFYLPMVGLIALFIFSYMSLLPIGYKLVMLGMVYLLTVVAPSLLIHLYRMVQGWTSRELGKKERRIVPYILYLVCRLLLEKKPQTAILSGRRRLLRLFFLDGIPQYASRHQYHRSGSAGDTDDLRLHQCMVEDQHPYGSHRRCGRSSGVLFCSLQFQSAVVALPCADDGRRSRKCPHDTPTTYAVTGSCRISDRHSLCYIGNIKFIIKYKKK